MRSTARLLLALLACGPVSAKLPQEEAWVEPPNESTSRTPEETIRKWPETPQRLARLMIAKYGPPTRFSDDALVWLRNGPWEKTFVFRDAPAEDYLKQSIGYRVPPDKLEPLLRFDRRVETNTLTNELAARTGDERLNFLLLNLVDEIVTEKRGPEEASRFYDRTLRLAEAGRSSPYMAGFLFKPPNERTVTPP